MSAFIPCLHNALTIRRNARSCIIHQVPAYTLPIMLSFMRFIVMTDIFDGFCACLALEEAAQKVSEGYAMLQTQAMFTFKHPHSSCFEDGRLAAHERLSGPIKYTSNE